MHAQLVRRLVASLMFAITGLALMSARPVTATRSFALPHSHGTRHTDLRPVARAAEIFERHQAAIRDSIVRLALQQVGTPYEVGGATPEGFDCSGLVRFVFAQQHLRTPRIAAHQARIGTPIERDQLRPGDLLTFGTGDRITHIGIYVGDRKFVHASSVAGRVVMSHVDRRPTGLIRPLKGVRRVLGRAEVPGVSGG